MCKKMVLYLICFLCTGELMIRLDEKFKLFEDTHVVKIATGLTLTPEYKIMNENKIDFSGNNLRIMVIGDSYIAGGGIEQADRFSSQLKLIIDTGHKHFDSVIVLDVTKPNSNTLDNNQTYFHFADSFKPHVVILGYNLNDVTGNLERQLDPRKAPIAGTNSDINESLTKKIYKVYKKSKMLDFVLHKLHTELKIRGTIIPNSEFDLILKSYNEDRDNWRKSKVLLQEITDSVFKKNSRLIILKFPEINLLEHPELFVQTEKAIKKFYDLSPGVTYMNGSEIFAGENSSEYTLSKYDGHPNARAHKKMAMAVAALINTNAGLHSGGEKKAGIK